jgi:hypothetical protein
VHFCKSILRGVVAGQQSRTYPLDRRQVRACSRARNKDVPLDLNRLSNPLRQMSSQAVTENDMYLVAYRREDMEMQEKYIVVLRHGAVKHPMRYMAHRRVDSQRDRQGWALPVALRSRQQQRISRLALAHHAARQREILSCT